MTATYALKSNPRTGVVSTTTTRPKVNFPEKLRPTGRTIGGLFREVEGAGIDKKSLRLYAEDVRDEQGRKRSYERLQFRVANATDHIRRLRDEDVEALAAIDVEIDELVGQLRELRGRRKTMVRRAFTKGSKILGSALAETAEEAMRNGS